MYTVVRDLLGLARGPEVIAQPCECQCSVSAPVSTDCAVLERLLTRRLEPAEQQSGAHISVFFVLQVSFVFSLLGLAWGFCGGFLSGRRRAPWTPRSEANRTEDVSELNYQVLKSGRPSKGGKGVIVAA